MPLFQKVCMLSCMAVAIWSPVDSRKLTVKRGDWSSMNRICIVSKET
jgi:hypothetical protein